jgi:hypothetical protein
MLPQGQANASLYHWAQTQSFTKAGLRQSQQSDVSFGA